jgi:hypothetical protein
MEVGVNIPFIVLDGRREARLEDDFFLNKTVESTLCEKYVHKEKLVRKFLFIKSTLLLAVSSLLISILPKDAKYLLHIMYYKWDTASRPDLFLIT